MRFWLDTNILFRGGQVRALRDACATTPHTLHVSPLVVAETLFLKHRKWKKKQGPFDMVLGLDVLTLGGEVQVEHPDPIRLASHLAARFPTQEAWNVAKSLALGVACPPPNRRIPATVDFYICAPSPEEPIITDDKGTEWSEAFPEDAVLSYDDAIAKIRGTA